MGRATSGEPLTLLLIAVSILGGNALAIACSYRPIALWWVMVACWAISLARFGALRSRRARADRPDAPAARSRLAAAVTRALARSFEAFTGAKPGSSKASLDRQHRRFLVWFLEHNLFWTPIGFGASLLLWHRFGPSTPALVAMAALMTCGLFAALGAVAGATAPTLGLCWREPCQTPDFLSARGTVHDIGCVVVLKNRRDYAARCDWAKGGRFHELFLTVDDLARAGVEPGLEAVLAADDATSWRALSRKEQVDRALALTPVFAAGLLAALFLVPPLAGSEPLPSLWTIVSMNANSRVGPSASDDTPRDLPPDAAISSNERQAQNTATDRARSQSSPRADRDATSSSSHERPDITGSGHERPDITAQGGESSITGDAVASARGEGAETTGGGSGTPAGGAGNGAGSGSGESGGASSSDDGSSGGSGGRGGGPHGYGSSGVAPQRAESPNALPDAPMNPGKPIEVVLPAFAEARGDSPDDDPSGTKRKAKSTDQARAYQARREAGAAPNEPATREPVQRLPNWVFQVLHR